MRYFIGIDLGTSSVKSLLMDENGNVIKISNKNYDILKPTQSYAEQDIEFLWNNVSETLNYLITSYQNLKHKISGIGFSGQMHGLVTLDKNYEPARNTIIWADQRSKKEITKISKLIPDYKNFTLNTLSTGFLLSSLIWIKDNEPENYERIFKIMLPKDYIRFRMCNELGTDYSDASGTGVFNISTLQWSSEIIESLNLDKDIFVTCHNSYEIAGKTTKKCSDETGLPVGIPVVYGGGDTMVQTTGNGVTQKNFLISNIGTASQLLCLSDKPLYDSEFRTNTFCHVEKNQWLLMGANLNGGIVLKWLKNILNIDSFSQMSDLAEKANPGSDNLIFLPYLNGERTPWNDPDARAIFSGLSLKHGRPEIIRSAMEGIILSQRESLEIFKKMGMTFDGVIFSGGGAKSKIFRKILASILNCKVFTSSIEEQGCVGAAILASVGTKTFSSIKEACSKIIKLDEDFIEPDSTLIDFYDNIYKNFHEIYPANKKFFNINKKMS